MSAADARKPLIAGNWKMHKGRGEACLNSRDEAERCGDETDADKQCPEHVKRDEFWNDRCDAGGLGEVFGAEAAEWGGIENGAEEEQFVDAARVLPFAAEEDCGYAGNADQGEDGVGPNHIAGYDRG